MLLTTVIPCRPHLSLRGARTGARLLVCEAASLLPPEYGISYNYDTEDMDMKNSRLRIWSSATTSPQPPVLCLLCVEFGGLPLSSHGPYAINKLAILYRLSHTFNRLCRPSCNI
jgi:hypothetical protein